MTSGRASAVSAMPGSRGSGRRIALKRWVTVRIPRSKPAWASAAVASVWPAATVIPRAVSASTRASAPASSGASVTWVTRSVASSRSSRAGSGSRRCSGGWAPSRPGARNGPSRWAPRISGPAGQRVERGERVRLRGGDQRRQVGGDARGEQRRGRACVGLAVGVHQVDAGEAVDLEVDEAGRSDPAPRAGDADARDPAAVEFDVAGEERAVDQRRSDPEPHRRARKAVAWRRTIASSCPSARFASTRCKPQVAAGTGVSAGDPERGVTSSTCASPESAQRAV